VKQLLLIAIKLYWFFIPKGNRRPCLFKETCSQFVYKQTKKLGFFEGIKAFLSRYKKCRKGYKLRIKNDGFVLELIDGTYLLEENISPNILNPIISEIESKSNSLIEDSNRQTSEKISP